MLINFLSDDWKWWIWNHWKMNQDKDGLFTILLNHGFEYDVIRKELNYESENTNTRLRRESQRNLLLPPQVNIPPLWKPLADNPKARRIENVNLEVYEIDNFFTDEECNLMIEKIKPNLKQSTVTNPDAEKDVRTSSTSFLRLIDDEIAVMNLKVHELMRIPLALAEEPQGQCYTVGQEFKKHCDWFDKNSPYNKVHLNMGQRTYTFMVYLNDVEEGGETYFTKLDLAIKPKRGKALVWNNQTADGSGNWWSEHWGKPVIKGEKYIITKWFREHDGKNIPPHLANNGGGKV